MELQFLKLDGVARMWLIRGLIQTTLNQPSQTLLEIMITTSAVRILILKLQAGFVLIRLPEKEPVQEIAVGQT